MRITDERLLANAPWRDKYQQAWFRGAFFHVDTDRRSGGRRVALHQYPKRSIPYAEDLGRQANGFSVAGYLIGPDYLVAKDTLIQALEQDGPGLLRLPLPYAMSDVTVMVRGYAVTESRERGGMCTVEMEFVEYGTPLYRPTISTTAQIQASATALENTVLGPPTVDTATQAAPYINIFQNATGPVAFP
jgi:prophage DNA circulation protein